MTRHVAYVGLGSNLQDPHAQLEQALQALDGLTQTRLGPISPFYLSEPVGPPQPDYLNAVARLDTALAPLALLDQLLAIENDQGRKRGERWGPRTLDLDLLLYDKQQLTLPRLQLPHPELAQRPFVLYPLADIAPDLTLPGGTRLIELLALCPYEGLRRLADAEGPTGRPQTDRVGHREI